MTDNEPAYFKDIPFRQSNKLDLQPNNTTDTLAKLKQQIIQKDILWIKSERENIVRQIRETYPQPTPPKEHHSDDRSICSFLYDYPFEIDNSISSWFVEGGSSLEQANIIETVRSNSEVISYKANIKTPQDWNTARNIILNDSFFKRHQQLANTLDQINPDKPDKYYLNIFLDLNNPQDKVLIKKYNKELIFEETELGWQPILDLSNPPGNEFLFTPTAVDLFTSLEKVHLQLSDHLSNELVNRSEQRYGNSYVTLGREIAKLVSDPNRPLSTFFSTDTDSKDQLISKIKSLEIPKDPAAALLINTLKQISQRQSISDLPVSQSEISFKTGTCKDLETYFSSSVNDSTDYIVEVNGKKYLKSGTHHQDVKPMMINLETIMFNGIPLPPGNLFRNSENGYHYMRPTAFCFDQEYTAQVFGKEYRESINGWGPPDKTFQLISQFQ